MNTAVVAQVSVYIDSKKRALIPESFPSLKLCPVRQHVGNNDTCFFKFRAGFLNRQMWCCVSNTLLLCMDCLFQSSLAYTAQANFRKASQESFSGHILSASLPGSSLEKTIRHLDLKFVMSFYFSLSMCSVLVQRSSCWISTPIRIPNFQELKSCWWLKSRMWLSGRSAPGMGVFAWNFKKLTKPKWQIPTV